MPYSPVLPPPPPPPETLYSAADQVHEPPPPSSELTVPSDGENSALVAWWNADGRFLPPRKARYVLQSLHKVWRYSPDAVATGSRTANAILRRQLAEHTEEIRELLDLIDKHESDVIQV